MRPCDRVRPCNAHLSGESSTSQPCRLPLKAECSSSSGITTYVHCLYPFQTRTAHLSIGFPELENQSSLSLPPNLQSSLRIIYNPASHGRARSRPQCPAWHVARLIYELARETSVLVRSPSNRPSCPSADVYRSSTHVSHPRLGSWDPGVSLWSVGKRNVAERET